MRPKRGSLHFGLRAVWAALSLGLAACGGSAAPGATPSPSAPAGAVPAPSPARPALASPVASPSSIAAAVTASPTTDAAAAGGQSYDVQSGDTLATIAQQFYGDPTQWQRIYDANKDTIGSDPDKLKLGQKLTIPPKQS